MPPKKPSIHFSFFLLLFNQKNLIILILISILGFAFWQTKEAEAALNILDRSFGTGGIVKTSFGDFGDSASAVAIQADGKIVVAAYNYNNINRGFLVARYNPDGTLDTSFDGDGKTTTCIHSHCMDYAHDVKIQADGKIVVIGKTFNDVDYDFALVRYNTDGSPDTSFSGDGILSTRLREGANDVPFAMSIQPDGKIILVGYSELDGVKEFAVARYAMADGDFDLSFNGSGRNIMPIGGVQDEARTVAIQSDGKIIAAGLSSTGTGFNSVLVRYNSNGTVDNSFDSDGEVVTDFGAGISGIALQPDGKIIAVGGKNSDFYVGRYNTNGTFDTSFSDDGKLTTDIINLSSDDANAVIIQPDGKIVVAGRSFYNNTSVFTLTRYNTNGSLDTSFDVDGIVTTKIMNAHGSASDLVLQPDGKIIVVGGTIGDFAVVRYLSKSQLFPGYDFDGDGKTDISIFRPSLGEWWYQQSSDNDVKAFTFGTSTDKPVPADYDGDGKTDIAFWRPSTGEWFVLRSSNLTFFAAPFGISTDKPAPGDFDGDGKADFAVFREGQGTWFINKSTGGVQIIPFGTTGDIPQTADYDGDGKSDVAIYRPADGSGSGEWWVLRSSNGSVFATPFGSATDKPVPADYTGDGKADCAFWRPSTGEWFVLRSDDLTYYAAPFGSNADIPVAGDYDGDGKSDIAVFRPSNATWFVLKSGGGTLIQGFGATGDVPAPSAFVP